MGDVPEPTKFTPVPLEPRSWGWCCPSCGADNEISELIVRERADGAWEAEGPDAFPDCTECGAVVAVTPVWIQEVDDA